MQLSMTYLLPLHDCALVSPDLVGGKAQNLGILKHAGIPVPSGFVITTSAWRAVIEYNRLGRILRLAGGAVGRPSTAVAWRTIGNALRSARIPSELTAGLFDFTRSFKGKPLVVRSSAVGEDAHGQSFAGQYETILNVRSDSQLLTAIRECWASAWSDQVLAYLRVMGKPAVEAGTMAVIVQEMVEAAVSGVAFTRNPLAPQNEEMLIESAWGLGAAVVEGKVAADSYRIESATGRVIDKTIRYKLLRCIPSDKKGVEFVKSVEALRGSESLTVGQIRSLWTLASTIRDLHGAEQDIEWAGDRQGIYVLQSRPITTMAGEWDSPRKEDDEGVSDRQALLTMVDIGESWTGVLTPLGVSFIRHYQHHTHPALLAEVGLRDTGEPERYCRFILGRCYADVSYLAWLLTQFVLFRDQAGFMSRYATEDVALENYVNPYGRGCGGLRSNWVYLKTWFSHWRGYEKQVRQLTEKRLALFDAVRRKDLRSLSLQALRGELHKAYCYFHVSSVVMGPAYIGSFIYYDVLKAFCTHWLNDDGSLLLSLKSGATDLRTLDVNLRLQAMIEEARNHGSLQDYLLTTPVEDLENGLRRHPEAARFLELYSDFLRMHGVRGRLEMDLFLPRWVDDPSYIFTVLKAELSRSGTADMKGEITVRQRAIEKRLAKLWFLKRRIFHWAMKRYFDNSRLREEVRMSYLQGIWMVRRVVQEVIDRMVVQGVLRNREEAAFITYEQIDDYLAGKGDPSTLFKRNLIERNRRAHFRNLRIHNLPLTVIGGWDPSEEVISTDPSEAIKGVGGSAGRVVGKARVIFDLQRQMDEFEPGEILITQATDTTWTPLFSIASAVVTDIGSVLSHSSIVARELGIPSVVNTKIATQTIRTGDMITVDGNVGKVFRHVRMDKDEPVTL